MPIELWVFWTHGLYCTCSMQGARLKSHPLSYRDPWFGKNWSGIKHLLNGWRDKWRGQQPAQSNNTVYYGGESEPGASDYVFMPGLPGHHYGGERYQCILCNLWDLFPWRHYLSLNWIIECFIVWDNVTFHQ